MTSRTADIGDPTPTALDYEGHRIRLDGAMLSLTDMWKAAGRPENRRPSDWLLLEETARFRTHAGTRLDEDAGTAPSNTGQAGIWTSDPDPLVVTLRGLGGGTWAHWQLALSYGRYLSPPFHLWCNTVVRAAMQRPGDGTTPAPASEPVLAYLAGAFERLHRRLDALEHHAADQMLLQTSSQELVIGRRRDFSERSRALMARAVEASPYDGRCPCCTATPVLDDLGRPLPGAEFDHVFHRALNKPENGWLVCRACHDELTYGGYLVRFERMPEFRRFQAAVLAQKSRSMTRPLPRPLVPRWGARSLEDPLA